MFEKTAHKRPFEVIFHEHISLSEDCAAKLMQLFLTMDNIPGRIREIIDLEHEGDRLNREVYRTIDRSFMTKIEKPDIQQLTHQLDDILDGLHDAAYLVDICDMKNIRQEAIDIVAVIEEMIPILKENIFLMTTRKGLSLEQSQEAHAKMDVLETKADEIWRNGVKHLYQELDGKEFIARKEMIDALEEVSDRCLKAMSVIDSIVRKDSH
jgi:hypothetical protein